MTTTPGMLIPTRENSEVKEKLASIKVCIGDEALALLAEEEFLEKWEALYLSCPWSTVFQSPEFVSTWYHLYKDYCLPIIVTAEHENKLTGLITLSKGKAGLITGAGESQAEYQVWLTSASEGDGFIKNALSELLKLFPGSNLQLKFIPAGAPVSWATYGRWNKRATIRQVKQPLMEVEAKSIAAELRKKNRKEKMNRLKRLGEVKFERIFDKEAFVAVFDELALQYEFRKGAVFNSSVFKADPLRKEFLIALFDKGLLHTTLFKVGEEIIASNVGASGKGWVHLQGLNTHDPAYARYSPGILHFLLLGSLLAEEGTKVFDLTPGSDSYKAGLATRYIESYQLNIWNGHQKYVQSAKYTLSKAMKKGALKLGFKANELKKVKWNALVLQDKLKSCGLSSLFKGILLERVPPRKIYSYVIETKGAHEAPFKITLSCNSLSDLLGYEGRGARQSRWEFLAEAMRRLEAGERSYTWHEQGRLQACAWLRTPRGAGEEGAVLEGVYCHPTAQEALPHFLQAVATKVSAEQGLTPVYALAGKELRSILSAT